jgi:base plate wedge protein 53
MANASYFYNFPLISYDVNGTGNMVLVTDIIHSVRLRNILLTNYYIYYKWQVQGSDTPEDIAYKYYGSTDYFWVVLLSNQIYDRYFDWVMTQTQLENYIKDSYGSIQVAQNKIHHYEDELGNIIDITTYNKNGGLIITHYNYCYTLNESRRNIKLIDKTYLEQVKSELLKILQTIV